MVPSGVGARWTCPVACGEGGPTNVTHVPMSFLGVGGFNNQRQSLERAVQLTVAWKARLVVPPVWVDPKHNPGLAARDAATGRAGGAVVKQYMPWSSVIDMDHLTRVLVDSGVTPPTTGRLVLPEGGANPAIQVDDGPLLAASFSHSFKGSRPFWVDTTPARLGAVNDSRSVVPNIWGTGYLAVDEVTTIGGPALDRGHPLCARRDGEALVLGLVGMVRYWRASRPLRALAASAVRSAPPLRDAAALAVDHLHSISPSYVCVHWRRGDKLTVSPGAYDFGSEEAARAMLTVADGVRGDEAVYVASDDLSDASLAGFRDVFGAHRIVTWPTVLASSPSVSELVPRLPDGTPWNDPIGIVEVDVCVGSRVFFASSSSFSGTIMDRRAGAVSATADEVDDSTNVQLTPLVHRLRTSSPSLPPSLLP